MFHMEVTLETDRVFIEKGTLQMLSIDPELEGTLFISWVHKSDRVPAWSEILHDIIISSKLQLIRCDSVLPLWKILWLCKTPHFQNSINPKGAFTSHNIYSSIAKAINCRG